MCDRFRSELPFYATGALSPAQRAVIERHLDRCADCRATLAEWRAVRSAVRAETPMPTAALPSIAPVLAAIHRPRVRSGTGAVARARRDGRARRGFLTLLALLLLLLLLAPAIADRDAAVAPVDRLAVDAPTAHLAVALSPARSGRPAPIARLRRPDLHVAASAPVSAVAVAQPTRSDTTSPSPLAPAPPAAAAPPAAPHAAAPPTAWPTVVPAPTLAPTGPPPYAQPTAEEEPSSVPPTSTMPGNGLVSGRVLGPDGGGRAEIEVAALSVDRPGDPARPTFTDPAGGYRLELPPGRWVLYAQSPAHPLRWLGDVTAPEAATPVTVRAGEAVEAVDFRLVALPAGGVGGTVSAADGSPHAAALVRAVRLADGAVHVAFSDASGRFRLGLEPGVYRIGAASRWSTAPSLWWIAGRTPEDADPVTVLDAFIEGLDLALPAGP
jgi:hypothetical protein